MRVDSNKQFPDSSRCSVCTTTLSGPVRVRLGESQLIECAGCGSWIYLPRLSVQQQATIHDTAHYFEHPYFQGRRQAGAVLDRRCRNTFARIEAGINLESLRGERMLDIGCDTGRFLTSAANQFGIVPVGIDVSAQAVQRAAQQGLEVYHTALEHAPDHLTDFRVITAIDLIEHLIDPSALLRQVFIRLRPDGVLYLETPNINSMVYRFGRLLCQITGGQPRPVFERLFPPQHVQYFTNSSLATLAKQCGFEVVRLDHRTLPPTDISTSLPIRLGVAALQLLDLLFGSKILLCALLRRPG